MSATLPEITALIKAVSKGVTSTARARPLGLEPSEADDLVSSVLLIVVQRLTFDPTAKRRTGDLLAIMPRDLSGGWPPDETEELGEAADHDHATNVAEWEKRAASFARSCITRTAKKIRSKREGQKGREDDDPIDVVSFDATLGEEDARTLHDTEADPSGLTEDDLIARIDRQRMIEHAGGIENLKATHRLKVDRDRHRVARRPLRGAA